MLVEVEDITFEAWKDDACNAKLFDINWDDDIDGDFAMWGIIYHLGKVVETDLKKDR